MKVPVILQKTMFMQYTTWVLNRHCYCEIPLWLDSSLLHEMWSAVLRLDNIKIKSPDSSSFPRAHFNPSSRDLIKLDNLKSALEVACHAWLLHPKISTSEYSIYVIEKPLLQPPLLAYHVYGKFPAEGDPSAKQFPTSHSKGNSGFPT